MKAQGPQQGCPRIFPSAFGLTGNCLRQRRRKQCLNRCQVRSSRAQTARPAATNKKAAEKWKWESMVNGGEMWGAGERREWAGARDNLHRRGDGPGANPGPARRKFSRGPDLKPKQAAADRISGPPRGRLTDVVSPGPRPEGGEESALNGTGEQTQNINGKGTIQGNQEGKKATTSSSARMFAEQTKERERGLVKSSTNLETAAMIGVAPRSTQK